MVPNHSAEPAQLRQVQSGTAGAYFKQGLALLRESRHNEAEACFREALSVDPTMATAWVGLSQIQAERGEIEQSCESARSALAVESQAGGGALATGHHPERPAPRRRGPCDRASARRQIPARRGVGFPAVRFGGRS